MTDDYDICVVCGEARAVHTHHRKLRSQGGGDEKTNTLRVCMDCHNWIHANPSEAYARGLLVHSWAAPALVEVFGAQAKLEALWAEQNSRLDSISLIDDAIDSLKDVPAVHEGEKCPTCERRVPHKKKPTSPKTKVYSTRVPIDDVDTFKELVTAASDHHCLTAKPHSEYWTLLYGLTLLLQTEKGELPA